MENERVVIRGYGAPSMLQVIHEPAPIPANGEVRIRVEAAGVSFGDVLQRLGLFFAGAPGMPYTPGYDVVGTVDAVGPDVDSVRVGDRVAALTLFGGYARYVCVPAEHVVTGVPGDLDAIKAVALVLNYTTAFQMLRRVANVRAGQSILVYGASGGVGTALLDLARHLGIIVAAAVSQRWQESFKGQAELLFDERDAASVETLRRFRPDGFDFAFDGLGGSHVWRTRSMVAKRGKLVAFGITSAVKPGGGRDRSQVIRLALLLAFAKVFRRPAVELYAMDRHIKTHRQEINEDIRAVIELLHNRAINPRIGASFALTDAEQAHRLIESRNNVGKIVLVP
jgi:NADPH:quinone reductase-like Zn-dependent oxidoreductase